MRDPLYVSRPTSSGHFLHTDAGGQSHSLYYELRGDDESKGRICMVMGAFGSLNWFDQLADHFATKGGFQVLTFDHRGVGQSRSSSKEEKEAKSAVGHLTASMLAEDCLALMDHVWGAEAEVHLYGASMGGMIVQELALKLVRSSCPVQRRRVKSILLAVTCRGIHWVHGVEPVVRKVLPPLYDTGIIRWFMPLLFSPVKDSMITHLLRICFSDDYLSSLHPSGELYKDIWRRVWSRNYEAWSTFHDLDVSAGHVMVLAFHYLDDNDAQTLRDSGIPITTHIATKDRLIPTHKQEALAKVLGATRIVSDGGHMNSDFNLVEEHLEKLLAHFTRTEAEQQQ